MVDFAYRYLSYRPFVGGDLNIKDFFDDSRQIPIVQIEQCAMGSPWVHLDTVIVEKGLNWESVFFRQML